MSGDHHVPVGRQNVPSMAAHLQSPFFALDTGLISVPFAEALEDVWDYDARVMLYMLEHRETGHRIPCRVRKDELDIVRARGWEPRLYYRGVDADTSPDPLTGEKHPSITDEQVAQVHARLRGYPCLYYITRGGVRIFQQGDRARGPEEYEAMYPRWAAEVQEVLGDVLEVDLACADWTRGFRLPRVVRQDDEHRGLDLRQTTLHGVLPVVDWGDCTPLPPRRKPESLQLPDDVDSAKVLERASNYLAKMPSAISGEGGHTTTYLAARVLVWGFALDRSAALDLLEREYNPRCEPEWDRKTLVRKVADADSPDKQGRPRGYLLVADGNWAPAPRFAAPIQDSGSMAMDDEDTDAAVASLLPDHTLSPPDVASEAEAARGAWKANLKRNKNGRVKPTYENCLTFLSHCPALKDKLVWDEFNQRITWVDSGRFWSDEDTTRVQIIMNRIGLDVGREQMVTRTLAIVARKRTIHPVRDYLDGLQHDGQSRLDTWLRDYLGAEPARYPETYLAKIGRWWMVQAVRRIYEPGAPAKYVLTLEGNQDIGKSHALRLLASPSWFSDSALNIGNKEGAMALHGKWIQEFAEAEILTHKSKEKVKQYIGQNADNYVPKFSNEPVDVPRHTVFAMTVNPTGGEYLSDPTGNVRYWPVWCTTVDFDGLARDRDQLWAEAVALYKGGEIPEPRTPRDKALLAEVVAARVNEDPWAPEIRALLEGQEETWVEQVLDHLEIPPRQREQRDKNRVVRVLQSLGFAQGPQGRREGKKRRLYRRQCVETPCEEASPIELALVEQRAVHALEAAGWKVRTLGDGRTQVTHPGDEDDPFAHVDVIDILGDV